MTIYLESPAARWAAPLRAATAGAFVLSSGLLLLGDVLDPPSSSDYVADMAAHPDRSGIAIAISLIAVPFLVATVVAWTALSRAASPRVAWSGGALMVTGACALAAVLGAEIAQLSLVGVGVDPATVGRALQDGLPTVVLLVMFLGGTVLGSVLSMIGLWRSHAVPRGSVVVFAVFAVIDFTPLTSLVPFPKHAIMFAALTWMAVAVARAARPRLGAVAADRAVAH